MRKQVELLIDEAEEMMGIEAVSLVKFPAIETDFVYLSEVKDNKMVFATDDDKRLLIGPALIPEKLIMRLDEDDKEYDVFFSKETVRQAMELFMREARTNEHTLEHQSKIDGVTVVESWLIEDSVKDKSALYDFSLPEGTWMLSVKVNNDEIWKKVKARDVRGFSIEGYFTDRVLEMTRGKLCKNCPSDKDMIDQLKSILLEEVKPSMVLNGKPLFKSFQEASMWSEMFNDTQGFTTFQIDGQTLFGEKEVFESYPWDKCMADQMNEYGDKEVAAKICGAIKAKYG